jgi:hypothetical protein
MDEGGWNPVLELHLQPFRSERNASALSYTRCGAHSRICTGIVRVLSAPSPRWTTWSKWYRVRDFHPQPSVLSGAPLVVGLNAA